MDILEDLNIRAKCATSVVNKNCGALTRPVYFCGAKD